MSETETDAKTLCDDCGATVSYPQPINMLFGMLQPIPLCGPCLTQRHFDYHRLIQKAPYQTPHPRPTR